jgi:hypothetical protein
MRWAGYVAGTGEGRYRVLVGKHEVKDHLKDQGVDGRIGSICTLGRLAGRVWSGFTLFRIGTVCGVWEML